MDLLYQVAIHVVENPDVGHRLTVGFEPAGDMPLVAVVVCEGKGDILCLWLVSNFVFTSRQSGECKGDKESYPPPLTLFNIALNIDFLFMMFVFLVSIIPLLRMLIQFQVLRPLCHIPHKYP
jgi:hypothetical protein